MKHGKLIILMGAMGSGKSTLMKHAISLYPELGLPCSYTTRERRADHVENDHYRFVSREEFEQRIRAGEFLEYALFSGNYYGTRKADVLDALAEGKVLLKEMEVQGVRQVKEALGKDEVLTVFVNGGSWDEMKQRALARGEMTAEDIERRHKRFEDEITFLPEADVVIDNTTSDRSLAKAAFADLIQSILSS